MPQLMKKLSSHCVKRLLRNHLLKPIFWLTMCSFWPMQREGLESRACMLLTGVVVGSSRLRPGSFESFEDRRDPRDLTSASSIQLPSIMFPIPTPYRADPPC